MPSQVDHQEIHLVVDSALLRFSDPTGQVLNVLNTIQTHFRYLPEEALSYLSERTGIPYSKLYGIGSFFEDLSFDPVGKYLIKVCDGTACHTRGAPELVQALEDKLGIKVGETTPDGLFTLRTVHCVGACGLAPIIIVDEKTLGRVALKEAAQFVKTLE
jgi:NADH:ubiquinone oxidoreductase subunit E